MFNSPLLTLVLPQVRLLKTKVTRAAAESRDRRRTHSLKGKDAFGLGKDVDQKLSQLEAKIAQLMPTIDTGLADGSSPSVVSFPVANQDFLIHHLSTL